MGEKSTMAAGVIVVHDEAHIPQKGGDEEMGARDIRVQADANGRWGQAAGGIWCEARGCGSYPFSVVCPLKSPFISSSQCCPLDEVVPRDFQLDRPPEPNVLRFFRTSKSD
ncbi:MAG TPA: hypothetical protein EYP19_15160 [Desulfobacterales bacterium]|jgi:hypothetical protein|nr:hypothetical protein [Desulfobacterales bacterium]